MSETELGVIFALTTAFSWALAGVIHTAASRMVGIKAVMLIRQPLASLVLGIVCLVTGGLFLPSAHLFWLAATSGLCGIIIGDACFYNAALTMGLRPTQICQTLSACFTALLGSLFLDEYIGIQGWTGMFVATCGVVLVVVSEQGDVHNPSNKRQRNKGVCLALLSSFFLALGMIFSKQALQEDMGALTLSFYRNAISTVGIWGLAFLCGAIRPALTAVRVQPGVFKLFPLGCIFGPAGGIWLSCVALNYLPAAIASMLIGLEPIALLIILGFIERRLPAKNSILGALVACLGAAILLMR